jgi:murein tripeptide amidase MpaA
MFFNAVHHAREPMSMSQLIFFMWHILENYNTDKDIKTLVNSTELYVVPCVNPDGYVYNQGTNPSGGGMWRKNRRNNGNGTFGVDPNRNYAYKWGR